MTFSEFIKVRNLPFSFESMLEYKLEAYNRIDSSTVRMAAAEAGKEWGTIQYDLGYNDGLEEAYLAIHNLNQGMDLD